MDTIQIPSPARMVPGPRTVIYQTLKRLYEAGGIIQPLGRLEVAGRGLKLTNLFSVVGTPSGIMPTLALHGPFIREQNYTGEPGGEPNPEIYSSGPWPYPDWPLYVLWWHEWDPGR